MTVIVFLTTLRVLLGAVLVLGELWGPWGVLGGPGGSLGDPWGVLGRPGGEPAGISIKRGGVWGK